MPHSPHMQTSVIPLLYLQRHVAGNGSASRVPLPSVPPVHLGPLLTVASNATLPLRGRLQAAYALHCSGVASWRHRPRGVRSGALNTETCSLMGSLCKGF